MPFTLTMPKLSPTMDSGTIVHWHKKEGDAIEVGDVLMDVATDKATVEYEAIDSGYLRKLLINEGQEAVVNQPIAVLTETKDESIDGYKPPQMKPEKAFSEEPKSDDGVVSEKGESEATEEPTKVRKGTVLQQPSFVPEAPLENYEFEYPREGIDKKILASPLAKKIAKEKGLDISSVKGSGPNGRIMNRDLGQAQATGTVNFANREAPKMKPGSYEEIALSPIRKVIGQRLQESKSFIPHFYIQQEINAESLLEIREQLKNGEIKVSINDLIVRGCALALRLHPEINRGYNSVNQTIIQFQTIDIAIAVSMEEGLITPIVRHADFKNLGEISAEVRFLAQRAKEGKLEAHEYKGGSFTISNMGMYGVTDFQAIINPPQAAILAVSSIQDRPIVHNGVVVAGKTMNVTLSVDHRVIDGSLAAKFLKTLKHYLENPVLLLV